MKTNYGDINFEYEFETIQHILDKLDRDIFLDQKVDFKDIHDLVKLFDCIDIKQVNNVLEDYDRLRMDYLSAEDHLENIKYGIDIIEKKIDVFGNVEEALNILGVDSGKVDTYSLINAKDMIEVGYNNLVEIFE